MQAQKLKDQEMAALKAQLADAEKQRLAQEKKLADLEKDKHAQEKKLAELEKKVKNSNSVSAHNVSHNRDLGNGQIQQESQQTLSQNQSISSDPSRAKLGLTGIGATPVSSQDVVLKVDVLEEDLNAVRRDIEQIKATDSSSKKTQKSSFNPLSFFRSKPSTAPQPSTTVSTRSYSPSTSVEEWLRDVKLEKYCSFFRDTLGLVILEDLAVFKDYSLEDLEKVWKEFTIIVSPAHRSHLVRELGKLAIC